MTPHVSSALSAGANPGVSAIGRPAWLDLPLYVDPGNTATAYATANPTVKDVGMIARMGRQPVAHWFGEWDGNVTSAVDRVVSAASATGSIPVLVFYNIPYRDCGSYSANSGVSSSDYLQWVQLASAGIGDRPAVVVVEPDALAGLDCLSQDLQQDRLKTISQAVTIIKASKNAAVYVDAGNPTWQTPAVTAARLTAANVAKADGFSLNVSNFSSTQLNIDYGEQVSRLTGGKHYIIDTSRNGAPVDVTKGVFNPPGAGLGQLPTTQTNNPNNDALLWIKIPWESDAPVNGGPVAGAPYWSYAVSLAHNGGW